MTSDFLVSISSFSRASELSTFELLWWIPFGLWWAAPLDKLLLLVEQSIPPFALSHVMSSRDLSTKRGQTRWKTRSPLAHLFFNASRTSYDRGERKKNVTSSCWMRKTATFCWNWSTATCLIARTPSSFNVSMLSRDNAIKIFSYLFGGSISCPCFRWVKKCFSPNLQVSSRSLLGHQPKLTSHDNACTEILMSLHLFWPSNAPLLILALMCKCKKADLIESENLFVFLSSSCFCFAIFLLIKPTGWVTKCLALKLRAVRQWQSLETLHLITSTRRRPLYAEVNAVENKRKILFWFCTIAL